MEWLGKGEWRMVPLIVGVLLVLFDQATKLWALSQLKPIGTLTWIEGFMDLTFVENRGVAFGMFSGQRWMILLLTGIIVAGMLWLFVTLPRKKGYQWVRFSFLLILSGAIGNMIDRLWRGYVVDFFEFTFFEWPVFNVADIYVVFGVILLAILILFVVEEEDLKLKKKDE